MLRRLKRDQWLIQALGLPVGWLRARVSGDAVNELVMPPIVARLVSVLRAHAGRIDQRQAKRVIVRFVGAVLSNGENRRAELAGFIGQIDPLM